MAKGQTLGEMFPKGRCFLCMQPCDPEGICHPGCANAFTAEKERLMREKEAPIRA